MPSSRASLFATDSHPKLGCTVHPFLSDAHLSLHKYQGWLTCPLRFSSQFVVCPPPIMCQWVVLHFQTDSAVHLSGWWKTVYIRSFHSSVLTLEHSPNAERLHIPPCCVEPKKHWQAWAAFMGALGGKRGLTRCGLKRPSFGCLTQLKGMADRYSFSSTCWPSYVC